MRGTQQVKSNAAEETLVQLFDALLAGSCTEDIHLSLQRLPERQRQGFLCTACEMRDEVAVNCIARAHQIDLLLSRNYPHYHDGVRACTRYRRGRA